MLTKEPTERITAEQAKNHEWIIGIEECKAHNSDLRFSLRMMKEFNSNIGLQKAILTYFATHSIPEKEEIRIRELFNSLDIDKDGNLSLEDLQKGYEEIFGEGKSKIAKQEAEKIIRNLDLNKNGMIDYTEFIVANLKIGNYLNEAKLKEAFDFYDKVIILNFDVIG